MFNNLKISWFMFCLMVQVQQMLTDGESQIRVVESDGQEYHILETSEIGKSNKCGNYLYHTNACKPYVVCLVWWLMSGSYPIMLFFQMYAFPIWKFQIYTNYNNIIIQIILDIFTKLYSSSRRR